MCGISGIFCDYYSKNEWRTCLHSMGDRLIHRGPDDSGIWFDADAGIGFSHRRLSIIDLSTSGHQPMVSQSGRYVIVYNGESYNFTEIRIQLENTGYSFRGHSDTEVILAAIEKWELMPTIKKLIGMFAFALWDRQERLLHLVRDRIGIKPLYYGQMGKGFVFSSELSPFKTLPKFKGEINRDALALLLRHNYIPAPLSIYKGISKLLPGHILTVIQNGNASYNLRQYSYWNLKNVIEKGINNDRKIDTQEATEELERLLSDAVSMRMISDVPIGAFLSGGLDSSTVVALMQAHSSQPIKTFTIGFYEDQYNEAVHAKAIAKYLGTDHTELYVTLEETLDVVHKLPHLYDEPFSDSSQIPTYLISQLARQKVTVSLSGDGGDELFGGYNRYQSVQDIWRRVSALPFWGRKLIRSAIQGVPDTAWDNMGRRFTHLFKRIIRYDRLSDKLKKIVELLSIKDAEKLYHMQVSHCTNPTEVVIGSVEPITFLNNPDQHPLFKDFIHYMMYADLLTYLPDDILVKLDRASMGVSLEARVPILDHRIVEFAWQMPLKLKLVNKQNKWILRKVLYKYVPAKMVDRPKMGFGVPLGSWLRGPLRQWAEDLLDISRLRNEGYFKPEIIRQKWEEHLLGIRDWKYYLWNVLMFQAWHKNIYK